MAARRKPSPTEAAALEYAKRGWPVFPVRPRGKRPMYDGGHKVATTDANQIRQFWAQEPDANVAIATGSGIIILDVDCKNGKDGEASLRSILNGHGRLPPTLEASTPSGGRHLFYSGQGVPCSAGKLGEGLDVRGEGGYIVAPPSRTAIGSYKWKNQAPIAPMPPWLAKPPSIIQLDFSPQPIPDGQRNSMLASLAGTMRARGMSASAIEAALHEENDQRCHPPLPKPEVRRIAQSIARYEPEVTTHGAWSPVTDISQVSERDTIQGVLPEWGIGAIFGPAGSAKSTCEVAMASCIGLGLPWHERDIDCPSIVAIVAVEAPVSLKRRFLAWAVDNGVAYEELTRSVFVWEGALDLNSPKSVAAFTHSIPELISLAGTAPRVWFLDTLAAAMTGDENTKAIQDAVQALYNGIRQGIGRDPLLVLLHHTGKDESREERGHSSLRARLDTSIRIETGESTGAQPTKAQPSVLVKRGVATIRKQRDGVDGQAFPFEVYAVYVGSNEKGRPRSQVVVRHSTNIIAARADVAAKRSRATSMGAAIEAAFSALGGDGCSYQSVLQHVSKALGKDATELLKNFNRALDRAGFESVPDGKRRIVRRRTEC